VQENKMSWIPPFEIGLYNAWIFTIWLVIFPIISVKIIKGEGVSERLRDSAPMKHEKILNITSMGAIIIGFIYSIFLPIDFNSIWFIVGLILFLIGVIFDLSVKYSLRNAKINKPFTNGPYRYSRHPSYIALFLIILSIAIMSLSWIFLIILIIATIHLILAVPAEEKFCIKKYGEDYKDYLKRTPRWIGIPKSDNNK
jgi:protein-S-isoprenylcysteine O-methyltransferase Ste14